MGFLSFGSKKGKIKKLIEEERFDEIVPMVVKDKKALNALIELLDDPAPGIRGGTCFYCWGGTWSSREATLSNPGWGGRYSRRPSS